LEDPKCAIGLDPIELGKKFEKIDNIDQNVAKILSLLEKQNGRIGKLEQFKYRIIGVGSVLVISIPLFIKYIL